MKKIAPYSTSGQIEGFIFRLMSEASRRVKSLTHRSSRSTTSPVVIQPSSVNGDEDQPLHLSPPTATTEHDDRRHLVPTIPNAHRPPNTASQDPLARSTAGIADRPSSS